MSEKKIKSVHLVYFSPSGSTEKIVRKIASGIQGVEIKTHNLLPSSARKQQYVFGADDLVIYGSLSAGMLFTKEGRFSIVWREMVRRLSVLCPLAMRIMAWLLRK